MKSFSSLWTLKPLIIMENGYLETRKYLKFSVEIRRNHIFFKRAKRAEIKSLNDVANAMMTALLCVFQRYLNYWHFGISHQNSTQKQFITAKDEKVLNINNKQKLAD